MIYPAVVYRLDGATVVAIADHLAYCDSSFVPPLSTRIAIEDYAEKIAGRARRFEAWSGDTLVGLVAAYCNDPVSYIAYITSVSVRKEWTGQGIAARLMERCVEYAKGWGMRQIDLEVASANSSAIKLYDKSGFIVRKSTGAVVGMSFFLNPGKEHDKQT